MWLLIEAAARSFLYVSLYFPAKTNPAHHTIRITSGLPVKSEILEDLQIWETVYTHKNQINIENQLLKINKLNNKETQDFLENWQYWFIFYLNWKCFECQVIKVDPVRRSNFPRFSSIFFSYIFATEFVFPGNKSYIRNDLIFYSLILKEDYRASTAGDEASYFPGDDHDIRDGIYNKLFVLHTGIYRFFISFFLGLV